MQNKIHTYIKSNINILLLLLIIITGTIVRCYHFFSIPMTHDELSAISRLHYSSFHDLIEKGVKPDGHPAGIQILLYYWTGIFGFNDTTIKLPFIAMGIGVMILAYIIAKKWFNDTSALIITAYIATLQFPIMYSQISRPYISGLFLCLLAIYFWTNYLFNYNKNRKHQLIGFVLAASACSYNHHFSLLFAFIIYTTGLFFLKKKDLIIYLTSGLIILLLYIPHLGIFLYQLNIQGLDWLGVPRNTFIIDHIKYIFHFSKLVYITVTTLVLIGIIHQLKTTLTLTKLQIVALIWFFCSLLIGFYYSIYFRPVLQHSVLIFTFPFLLFFLFSFIKLNSNRFKALSIIIILSVNIYTLIYNRKHFEIFYKQPFNMFSELTSDFLKTHKVSEVTIMLNENPIYLDHYFNHQNPTIEYISTPDISLDSLRKIASTANTKYLICGNLPDEYELALKEYYPYLLFRDYGFTYEYYIFSKSPENQLNDVVYSQVLDFESENKKWIYDKKNIVLFSNRNHVYKMDSTSEWGPTFIISLKDISPSRHHFIDISIEYFGSDVEQGELAFEIKSQDSTIVWRGTAVQNYASGLKAGQWQKAYFSFRLSNQFKHIAEMENCKLTIFYWNNKKKNVLLDNFNIQVREGNEKIYSLVEDFNE